MKRVLIEKMAVFSVVVGVAIVVAYFYKQGKISFLGKKQTEVIHEAGGRKVEIPFKEKEYKLSYGSLAQKDVENIAFFEEDEDWQGDGFFGYTYVWEGRSSLSLVSRNYKQASTYLKLAKPINFKDILNFKLFIHLESNSENIENFRVNFHGENGKKYSFLINGLSVDWNFIKLPRERFVIFDMEKSPEGFGEDFNSEAGDMVSRVSFDLVSRPGTNSALAIDYFFGEKDDSYQHDWITKDEGSVNLGKVGGEKGLMLVNLGTNVVTMKKINSAKDYLLVAKFVPVREGSFGFFLRGSLDDNSGYGLTLSGVGNGDWQIIKSGIFDGRFQRIDLQKGKISSFEIEERRPYWLKAELNGTTISFYFSGDGVSFTKLGEVNDASFVSGVVGIIMGKDGTVLIDDFNFQNKT